MIVLGLVPPVPHPEIHPHPGLFWATVNCGVYYAGREWAQAMDRSFSASVSESNDELLWAFVLPDDILGRTEFWWGRRVAQIWSEEDFGLVGPDTYFAHVKHLEWARDLRKAAAASSPQGAA